MPEKVEDAAAVVVGRTYMVNVIQTNGDAQFWCGDQVPILGGAHDDPDLTDSIGVHYHVDWRFVTHARWDFAREYIASQYSESHIYRNPSLGMVVAAFAVKSELGRQELRCNRPSQIWDWDVKWMPMLERKFLNGRVSCNTCPHRGISLAGAGTDGRGAIVCPGHGLAWDKDTGMLRPRALVIEALREKYPLAKDFVRAKKEHGL